MSARITDSMRWWLGSIRDGLVIQSPDPMATAKKLAMRLPDGRSAMSNCISTPMVEKLLYRDLVVWHRDRPDAWRLAVTRAGKENAKC